MRPLRANVTLKNIAESMKFDMHPSYTNRAASALYAKLLLPAAVMQIGLLIMTMPVVAEVGLVQNVFVVCFALLAIGGLGVSKTMSVFSQPR
jgi:hypothetical protein